MIVGTERQEHHLDAVLLSIDELRCAPKRPRCVARPCRPSYPTEKNLLVLPVGEISILMDLEHFGHRPTYAVRSRLT